MENRHECSRVLILLGHGSIRSLSICLCLSEMLQRNGNGVTDLDMLERRVARLFPDRTRPKIAGPIRWSTGETRRQSTWLLDEHDVPTDVVTHGDNFSRLFCFLPIAYPLNEAKRREQERKGKRTSQKWT